VAEGGGGAAPPGAKPALALRTIDALFAHRKLVIAVWIVATLLIALAALRVRVDGRVDALVPEKDRHVAEYIEAMRRMGASEIVYVDVSADDPASLARNAGVVVDRLDASGLFREVFGRGSPDEMARTGRLVLRAAPYYLDEADYATLAARLVPDDLADRAESLSARLLEPGGEARESSIRRDPLDIAPLAMARVLGRDGARGGGGAGLVSKDGRHALVGGRTKATMGDEEAGLAVDALVASVAKELAGAAKVDWVGGHRFYRSNAQAITSDISLVSTAGTVLVLLVIFFGYPGWRSVAIAALSGLMAGVCAVACAALCFDAVSGVAVAFGGSLSGICVDYVVHLRAAPRRGETRRDAVRRVFEHVAPSVVIGAGTTAAAFLVLVASPVAAHRQIGLCAAAGVVGSVLFSLLVGPILAAGGRHDAPATEDARPGVYERLNRSIWRAILARPVAWLVLSATLIAAAVAIAPRLDFEPDLKRFESKDAATVAAEREFQATWGSLFSRTLLVIRAPDDDAAIERTERAIADLAPRDTGDIATAWTSAARVLPSARTQDARWVRWTAFWTPERRDALRRDLAAAAEPLGMRVAAFDPFFESLTARPAALTAAEIRETALAPMLDHHLIEEPGGVRSIVVAGTDTRDLVRRRDELAATGVQVLTSTDLGTAITDATRKELLTLALPSLLAVIAIVIVYYRSARSTAIVLLPLVGGLVISAAGLVLAGEPLSLMNLPVVVPMVGFSIDHGVFILDALREARERPDAEIEVLGERGAAVMSAALTTVVGGFAMLLATHPAIRTLGLTLSLSVVASALLAWTAVPALAGRRSPRK
jgi:predicted exporter